MFPVLIVITVAVGTFHFKGSALTMEAFLLSAIVAGIVMRLQGIPLNEITNTAMSGIKGIMPAIVILAFAYALNDLSRELQTAQYIVSQTQSWLTPSLLPVLTFAISALIAFSTGTSWGTYGIMMPLAVPIAFAFNGNQLDPVLYATVAAVAGGGVFGDHCSPLSDTSILASTGAASDHIDHVRTQLPYALIIGAISIAAYVAIGMTF